MQTATADITLHGAHRSLAPYSVSGKFFFYTKYLLRAHHLLVLIRNKYVETIPSAKQA